MDSRHNLIDYFAVCGLNVDYGLEPDQHSGSSFFSFQYKFSSRNRNHLCLLL